MTTDKSNSIDSRHHLQDAFALEQELLQVQLKLCSESIAHSGTQGDVNEDHFIAILRRYLPKRYNVDRGIVIDSVGSTSDQIDVIIYDNQYNPTLLDQHRHRYVPAEAVYAVFEVKPTGQQGLSRIRWWQGKVRAQAETNIGSDSLRRGRVSAPAFVSNRGRYPSC